MTLQHVLIWVLVVATLITLAYLFWIFVSELWRFYQEAKLGR